MKVRTLAMSEVAMRSDLVGFMGSIDRWLAGSVKLSSLRSGGRGFRAEMNQDVALLNELGSECSVCCGRGVQRFSIEKEKPSLCPL